MLGSSLYERERTDLMTISMASFRNLFSKKNRTTRQRIIRDMISMFMIIKRNLII